MFILRAVAAVSLVASAMTPIGAIAQEADNIVLQMEEFTCRDMLVRSGVERDFTIAYMHGFMSGKLNDIRREQADTRDRCGARLLHLESGCGAHDGLRRSA